MISIGDKVVCIDDTNQSSDGDVKVISSWVYVVRGLSYSTRLNQETYLLLGLISRFRTSRGLETGFKPTRFRKLPSTESLTFSSLEDKTRNP